MKRIFVAALLSVIFSVPSFAQSHIVGDEREFCDVEGCQPPDPRGPCWAAITGTAAHYSIGDGRNDGVQVEYFAGPPPGAGFAKQFPGTDPVICWAEGDRCPLQPPDGDNHNIPGIAACTGCTDPANPNQTPTMTSMNGLKCCLKFKQTVPPAGQNC